MNTAAAVTSRAIGGIGRRSRVSVGARIPWDVVAILLIGVVAELLAFPNVDYPSNDDWVYALAVKQILATGIGLGIGVALATILVRQCAILLVFALCAARAAERGWSARSLAALVLIVAFGAAEHLLFQYWLVESGRTPDDIVEITQDIFPPLEASLLRVLVGHGLALAQYLGPMLSPIYLATGFASSRRAAAPPDRLAGDAAAGTDRRIRRCHPIDGDGAWRVRPLSAQPHAAARHSRGRSRRSWSGRSGSRRGGGAWRGAATLVLVVFGGFSIAAVHDYRAFQGARLAASDRLEAAGVPPRDIEGGYEYNGFRLGRREYQSRPEASDWWKRAYPHVIASVPLPGYRIDARHAYRR